ncbi:MAG TPA: hypothetical protein VKB05_11585, partial [Pyrinomonadaceae bacterium]|nr:hypothetical protein [Pyrinomonadaceae bacterium]
MSKQLSTHAADPPRRVSTYKGVPYMRIVFPRVSTKLITLILTLAMLSSSLPLVVSLAAAQPKITWS